MSRDRDFEAWLVETQGVLAPTARVYASGLSRLRTVATEEEILYGDLEALADRHPSVRDAPKYRHRRAGPLRRAGRRYRLYIADRDVRAADIGSALGMAAGAAEAATA